MGSREPKDFFVFTANFSLCILLNMSRNMTKPTKWLCAQRRLRSTWALSAWRKLGSLATHWAHSKDSDQTGRMARLIWVFAGSTLILLVLSWGGSYVLKRRSFGSKEITHDMNTPDSGLLSLFMCRHYSRPQTLTGLCGWSDCMDAFAVRK